MMGNRHIELDIAKWRMQTRRPRIGRGAGRITAVWRLSTVAQAAVCRRGNYTGAGVKGREEPQNDPGARLRTGPWSCPCDAGYAAPRFAGPFLVFSRKRLSFLLVFVTRRLKSADAIVRTVRSVCCSINGAPIGSSGGNRPRTLPDPADATGKPAKLATVRTMTATTALADAADDADGNAPCSSSCRRMRS